MLAKDFKTEVLPCSKKLLRFATHFLKDEDLARDVVQDVFLKLWQKRNTLEEIENIEAFTMRMTRNRCLDVIRANKTIPIDEDIDRKLKEKTVDVHSKVELSESANQIKMLIKKLPDLQRTVIQLRDIEQLSYDEIAEATDLKVNAIRVNLSRARKKVRDEFLKINSDDGTKEIQQLLQRYFDGESTEAEEKKLEAYFGSGNVAEEVAEYAEFFGGISELANTADDTNIEDDVMDFILENEHREKTKYRSMWKMVTGIAASIIIVLGGFLFYQEQQKPFEDSFDNADEAYAYATQTLSFVSGKYNKGLAQFAQFDKLRKANNPVKKGTTPVVEFYKGIERMNSEQSQSQFLDADSL